MYLVRTMNNENRKITNIIFDLIAPGFTRRILGIMPCNFPLGRIGKKTFFYFYCNHLIT